MGSKQNYFNNENKANYGTISLGIKHTGAFLIRCSTHKLLKMALKSLNVVDSLLDAQINIHLFKNTILINSLQVQKWSSLHWIVVKNSLWIKPTDSDCIVVPGCCWVSRMKKDQLICENFNLWKSLDTVLYKTKNLDYIKQLQIFILLKHLRNFKEISKAISTKQHTTVVSWYAHQEEHSLSSISWNYWWGPIQPEWKIVAVESPI